MSSSYIRRQKVRTWQLVLLTLGGVLLFWGFIRFQGAEAAHAGFSAVRAERWDDALKAFDRDLGRSDDHFESYAGKGIALLGLQRGVEAESVYAHIVEVQSEGRTPATRLRIWKDRNTRSWGKYRGYFLHFTAWLHAERVLRAYRTAQMSEDISTMATDYDAAREEFVVFVEERRGAQVEYWKGAQERLDHYYQTADRTDAVTRARKSLKDSFKLEENTPEQLEAAYDPTLRRAVLEAPMNIHARTWNLLVLNELASRKLALADGVDPYDELRLSFKDALLIEQKRHATDQKTGNAGATLLEATRFLVALSWAADLLREHYPNQLSYYSDSRSELFNRTEEMIGRLLTDEFSTPKQRDVLTERFAKIINDADSRDD